MDLDYDDEPKPVRNERLIRLYELLSSLITSLTPTTYTLTLRDGTGEKLNVYIDEFITLTQDAALEDFKLKVHLLNGHNPWVSGEAYVRQLTGLANYLYSTNKVIGQYCGNPPETKFNKNSSSTTYNNHLNADQNSSQTTTVQVDFTQTIVTLSSALTDLEHKFPNESGKENRFAKAMKAALPMAKDSLGIVTQVLKIAGEIGLDPHTVLKSLGLG